MTEEIIKSITEAEEKATDMKTAAYARAAEIAAQAEIRAAEIARSSEEVCKAYRETQLKAAEADAQKNISPRWPKRERKRRRMPPACSKIPSSP